MFRRRRFRDERGGKNENEKSKFFFIIFLFDFLIRFNFTTIGGEKTKKGEKLYKTRRKKKQKK